MKPYAGAWRLLQTIPGIDQISAAMIVIEIGDDLRRFGSASRFLASWAALCPGNNESAGKRKSGRIRHGNPIIRYLLCEAVNAARRTKTVFRAKYESLVIRRGYKKTIIALAHKLIRTIYVILARRKPYRDSTFDYEAASVAKNAPRWIRALKKYGYWPQPAPAT
jgi:transposase